MLYGVQGIYIDLAFFGSVFHWSTDADYFLQRLALCGKSWILLRGVRVGVGERVDLPTPDKVHGFAFLWAAHNGGGGDP